MSIQAEALSTRLEVPVLAHNALKPAYSCIRDIESYFSTLQQPVSEDELIVIGDRILTDVVLANRMGMDKRPSAPKVLTTASSDSNTDKRPTDGTLAVFVDKVWKRDATILRIVEKAFLRLVERWTVSQSDREADLARRNAMFTRQLQ